MLARAMFQRRNRASGVIRRFALDHLTVTDTTPARLAEIAAMTGCSGMCLFLRSMPVLPAMPEFDLVRDRGLLSETKRTIAAAGLTVDMVYPFTISGRTSVTDFEPLLDVAAALGASLANVLCYDRDRARAHDNLEDLAALAATFGVRLAIEFYPPSAIGSLAAALEVVEAIEGGNIGVTLDLLHLVRSGEWPGCDGLLQNPAILIAQLCDGPMTMPAERLDWEAGLQRALPGEGDFDVDRFVAALRRSLPISIEVPQQLAIDRGIDALERACAAVAATRRAVGGIDGRII